MALRRLRSIEEAYQELVKEDNNTSITRNLIRKLCREKKVQCFNLGKKVMLDYDDLVKQINSFIISG